MSSKQEINYFIEKNKLGFEEFCKKFPEIADKINSGDEEKYRLWKTDIEELQDEQENDYLCHKLEIIYPRKYSEFNNKISTLAYQISHEDYCKMIVNMAKLQGYDKKIESVINYTKKDPSFSPISDLDLDDKCLVYAIITGTSSNYEGFFNLFEKNDLFEILIKFIETKLKLNQEDIDFITRIHSGKADTYITKKRIDNLGQSLKQKSINVDSDFEVKDFSKNLLECCDGWRKKSNEIFIEREIKKNESFFKSITPYGLTEEQKTAIVIDEDNVLVNAAAGSGKTTTIIAKIRYLIEKKGVSGKKICVVAFNRDAAREISKRLKKNSVNDSRYNGLICTTFHKRGFDIIKSISEEDVEDVYDPKHFMQFYNSVKDELKIDSVFSEYLREFEESSLSNSCSEQQVLRYRLKYGLKADYKDIDGKEIRVKSLQEKLIANFLSKRGLSFRYEYPLKIKKNNNKTYTVRPDFTIYSNVNNLSNSEVPIVYYEHFGGFDKDNNKIAPWFKEELRLNEEDKIVEVSYKDSMEKKLASGIKLIKTFGSDFKNGEWKRRILDQLDEYKDFICIKNHPTADLADKDLEKDLKIADSIERFIKKMEERGIEIEDVEKKAEGTVSFDVISNLIKPFYLRYQKYLEKNRAINYQNMIDLSGISQTDLKDLKEKYDYILVDEFQDISNSRKNFLLKLRGEKTKLFCVGDDYQAINGFAGSDVSIFRDFQKHFGNSENVQIRKTFRFGNPMVEQSTNFIKGADKNGTSANVLIKEVEPFDLDQRTTWSAIEFNESNKINLLTDIINKISKENDKDIQPEVLILSRFNEDIDELRNKFRNNGNKFNDGKIINITIDNIECRCSTVHSSKGLEADYVVILNCSDDLYKGFPSRKIDYHFFSLLDNRIEDASESEERRLFYVAITRAKKHTFIMYPKSKKSIFIYDLEGEEIPNLCPKCKAGYLEDCYTSEWAKKNNKQKKVCSNRKYGCTYTCDPSIKLNK